MHAAALLYPGCIEFEIMLAIELIGRAFEVRILTPDGADHRGRGGIEWKARGSFAAVDPSELMCILIPGGDPGSIVASTDIDRLLTQANQRRITIGAICAGPLLLGKAGLLNGRKFTHGYGSAELPFVQKFFEGGTFLNAMVVHDDNLVTAKAQGHTAFGVEVARICGALATSPGAADFEASRLLKYYGVFPRPSGG